MFAEQRQLQVLESSAGEDLTGKTVRLQADRIEVRLVKLCADLLAARFKHRLHRRLLAVNDSVAAGLMIPDLVAAIFSSVSPRTSVWSSPMLHRTRRLGGQDHVCRVKFAAHADLADYDVAFFALEVFKAQRRNHFKFVGCSKIESAKGLMYSVSSQIASSGICCPLTWMRSLKRRI